MAKKGIPFYKSVLFKIPMIFILVVLLSLQIIGAYFIKQLESEMLASFDEQVSVQMSFLEESARPILDDDNLDNQEKADRLNTIFHRFNSNNILESQILDRNGFLVASSSPNSQAHLGQRVTREDIDQTLYNNTASSREIYDTEQNIRVKQYVAPILSSYSSGQLVGVLNLRVNIESVYRQIQNIIIIYLTSSAVSLLFTIVLAFLISTGITRPLKAMKDQAEKIADGDFNGQVQVYSDDEIGNLAESINYLSVRVKEAQESTESERQRLDSVLKHMTDGVMATDRRGRIILTNRKALDFISASEEEVMGHSIMEVLKLQDRYTFRELFDSNDEILIDMSTPDQESVIKGEYSIIQRDSGFISGLVWVLTDVTEREKIERDRRQFVSNVSHELRTPLTSVRSYSEALADGAIADQDLAVEFLGVIQNETDRMIRMIGDLLHLSNMDSGKEQLNFELVSFTALVSHVLDRFDMMMQSGQFGTDRSFTIVRELAGDDYFVEIDQDRMTQVIDNIINNAIKYSPDGGTITVRLMSTHNEVTLSVQDQGLGVPQKSIPHLFDRFYRVDKARSRAQGGTGLGLAIAKEVIEMHHGRIWVNSIENKGSTFFVSLPYVEFYGEDEWGE
ncbi:cell wall metabolism sensor histidine kinase WalK [Aerococcus sp. UMB10185]|uniref:cell wall metabolism sensor histidine kinase WalK n=1 Tax=unclassified Aerococcus TaxID=2618060 RepID=UPI00254D0051|nr:MULTISPECIES: cell wall metabolism sensor histidine kinase WalK [unclassified Aerococcus]MDK6233342.1 cell wall metabolism sensor histidine kinase WalK [Aerococcus sp. UMB10185]MDK6855171.1 cell wall metabolism sensor histidine kinase WalK [Aerococcus sp. UMB7533]